MDDSVSKITAALKKNQMFDDTLVIFISDNGGWYYKISLQKTYETGNWKLDSDEELLINSVPCHCFSLDLQPI